MPGRLSEAWYLKLPAFGKYKSVPFNGRHIQSDIAIVNRGSFVEQVISLYQSLYRVQLVVAGCLETQFPCGFQVGCSIGR